MGIDDYFHFVHRVQQLVKRVKVKLGFEVSLVFPLRVKIGLLLTILHLCGTNDQFLHALDFIIDSSLIFTHIFIFAELKVKQLVSLYTFKKNIVKHLEAEISG